MNKKEASELASAIVKHAKEANIPMKKRKKPKK
jgi:type III secretion system FlhB-like substrate exporter